MALNNSLKWPPGLSKFQKFLGGGPPNSPQTLKLTHFRTRCKFDNFTLFNISKKCWLGLIHGRHAYIWYPLYLKIEFPREKIRPLQPENDHFSYFWLGGGLLHFFDINVRTYGPWGTKIVKMYSPDCAQMRSPAVKNPKFSGGRTPQTPSKARAYGTSRRVRLPHTQVRGQRKRQLFSNTYFPESLPTSQR